MVSFILDWMARYGARDAVAGAKMKKPNTQVQNGSSILYYYQQRGIPPLGIVSVVDVYVLLSRGDTTRATVPVAMHAVAYGLGQALVVGAQTSAGSDRAADSFNHGEGCSEGGDEDKDNIVEGHGLFLEE